MNSKEWGKNLWDSLYFIARGYDYNNDADKDKYYVEFMKSLGSVLPCKFCRVSYHQFFDEIHIEKYLYSPCGLMKFVYDMHEKVSNKLRLQESAVMKQEFVNLQKLYKVNSLEFWYAYRVKSQHICNTQPTPSFDSVIEHYDQFRAGCSEKLKSCRLPFGAKDTDNQKEIVTEYGPIKTDTMQMEMKSPVSVGGRKIIKKKSIKKSKKRISSKRKSKSKKKSLKMKRR